MGNMKPVGAPLAPMEPLQNPFRISSVQPFNLLLFIGPAPAQQLRKAGWESGLWITPPKKNKIWKPKKNMEIWKMMFLSYLSFSK